MSTAANAGQSGAHAISGRGNNVHGPGSRGGPRTSVSAAPPPNNSITCAFDSFTEAAGRIRHTITAAAINALKKKTTLEQTISKLEFSLEDGGVPKTLLGALPKAYGIQNGDPSSDVVAAKAELERVMLLDAITKRKSELSAIIGMTVDPVPAFVSDFKKAVHYEQLPRDLKADADKVIKAQSSLLQLQWIQAKADVQSKSDQAELDRIHRAEAEASKAMELEQAPTRQLLDDLVKKQVNAAIKALNKASSSVGPNPNLNAKRKGVAQGRSGNRAGKRSNSEPAGPSSSKSRKDKGNQSKSKNSQRKGQ